MSNFTEAIAGAGLDLASGLFNTGVQYATSKKLMDYQNKINIQNWKMANEYNSPSAQMARYKAAGLNPNLVYGSLGQTAAGNISSPSASGINPRTNFGSSVANFQMAAQQRKVLQAQEHNLKLQNDQISANIKKTDAETENIKTNTFQTQDLYPLRKEAQDFANQMSKFGIDKMAAESQYYEINAYLDSEIKANQTILQHDQHVLNLVTKLEKEANISRMQAERALIGARILLTKSQVGLTQAQTRLTNTNEKLAQSNIQLTDGRVMLLAKEITLAQKKIERAPYETKALELKNANQYIENYIYSHMGKREATTKLGPLDITAIIYGATRLGDPQSFYNVDPYNFNYFNPSNY